MTLVDGENMAGSLIGENNKTQLQRPCDDPYQDGVGIGTGQEGIYPGSSKAALAERGKEELWQGDYGIT